MMKIVFQNKRNKSARLTKTEQDIFTPVLFQEEKNSPGLCYQKASWSCVRWAAKDLTSASQNRDTRLC